MATKQKLTAGQYLALPETKPYAEYWLGEVTPKVAPGFTQGACETFDADGEAEAAQAVAHPALPGLTVDLSDLFDGLD